MKIDRGTKEEETDQRLRRLLKDGDRERRHVEDLRDAGRLG